jgi:predicted murein hydrolase (TIGR00659 family)
MNSGELLREPLFGITLTVAAYTAGLMIHKKWRKIHPLFVTAAVILSFLIMCGIPYEAYKPGGDWIQFLLGPSTVALGVPIYKHGRQIKAQLLPILSAITVGAVSSMVSSAALLLSFHGSRQLILTMLPKSASTPISVELVRLLGGVPEIGAVFTVFTGLLGSMYGPELLRLCGVRQDIPLSTAIGTAAHGIGTARLVRENELQGSVSSFAMGMTGILTSLLVIPLYLYLR